MDIITKGIYDSIEEVSDLSLQKKLWLNENNNEPDMISSFTELLCILFDNYNFEFFVQNASKYGYSEDIIIEFKKLLSLLNNYDEMNLSDSEIIADPKWHIVVNQAKIVLTKWNPR